MRPFAILAIFSGILAGTAGHAVANPACADLDRLYPQPGRAGGGFNSYRPLPTYAPMRAQPGDTGTMAVSMTVNHVSSAQKGKPGVTYVGNYPVTDIPVTALTRGANTSVEVIDPETGLATPISDQCLNSPDWGFGGTQWSVVQGDTLDIMLQSRLDYVGQGALERPVNGGVPCRASNLHTHGLLVSPYHPARAGLGPYGDYVLDATQPRHSFDYGTDIDNCGTMLGDVVHHGHGLTDLPLHYVTTIPGSAGVSSMVSGQHPSGLFWYHPHPHGYSGSQIGGGTTGALTVGALTDYACPAGDGEPGHCTITNTNTRVMVLKDTQVVSGDAEWTTIHAADSGLCAPTGGTRYGECQGSEGSLGPTKWIFTINGVQFPTANIPAGRMEIWRLINASPSMTYNLSIIAQSPGQGHAELPFQLLAKDGVAIAQPDGHAVKRTQFLLMPASRIEIAIPAPAAGGAFMLHNAVAQTGGNGSGDIWPEIDLARFTWQKADAGQNTAANAAAPDASAPALAALSSSTPTSSTTSFSTPSLSTPGAATSDTGSRAPAEPPALHVTGPSTPIPHVAEVVAGPPGPCTFQPGDTRLVYFTHRFVHVIGSPENPPASRGQSGLLPHINEVFGLIAGIRHADGSEDYFGAKDSAVLHSVEQVWAAGKATGDNAFPAFGHNDWGTICTVKGNVEPWELINYTGEDHNFHLHQSRFTVNPSGVFQYPLPGVKVTKYLRETDDAVREYATPSLATFSDTIPVPRGQSFCAANPSLPGCKGKTTTECTGIPGDKVCPRPGKMSIIVDFSRAEQVGKFVYHCHIMEHEDAGMMAQISVLCPKGDTSCAAQQAQTAICRPPT